MCDQVSDHIDRLEAENVRLREICGKLLQFAGYLIQAVGKYAETTAGNLEQLNDFSSSVANEIKAIGIEVVDLSGKENDEN